MHQDMHKNRSKLAGISFVRQLEQSRYCSRWRQPKVPPLSPEHRTMRSHLFGRTYPTSRTDKRPVLRQKSIPGSPFKSSQRPHPPLGLCQRGPLLWDSVPYHPMVPSCHRQTTPCRPGGVPMKISRPCQHSSLTTWQQPIVKPPCVHSQLLPVDVTNLKHAILRAETKHKA